MSSNLAWWYLSWVLERDFHVHFASCIYRGFVQGSTVISIQDLTFWAPKGRFGFQWFPIGPPRLNNNLDMLNNQHMDPATEQVLVQASWVTWNFLKTTILNPSLWNSSAFQTFSNAQTVGLQISSNQSVDKLLLWGKDSDHWDRLVVLILALFVSTTRPMHLERAVGRNRMKSADCADCSWVFHGVFVIFVSLNRGGSSASRWAHASGVALSFSSLARHPNLRYLRFKMRWGSLQMQMCFLCSCTARLF